MKSRKEREVIKYYRIEGICEKGIIIFIGIIIVCMSVFLYINHRGKTNTERQQTEKKQTEPKKEEQKANVNVKKRMQV